MPRIVCRPAYVGSVLNLTVGNAQVEVAFDAAGVADVAPEVALALVAMPAFALAEGETLKPARASLPDAVDMSGSDVPEEDTPVERPRSLTFPVTRKRR